MQDFPEPGIVFKDITPVLSDGHLFDEIVAHQAALFADAGIDVIAGIESRGFILGAAVAARMRVGFIPIRKTGKLPYHTVHVEYALEYGTDSLEAHVDAIQPGQNTLIIDDVLATGGTAWGACDLIRRLGGRVQAVAVLIELGFLGGRQRLDGTPLHTLVRYE